MRKRFNLLSQCLYDFALDVFFALMLFVVWVAIFPDVRVALALHCLGIVADALGRLVRHIALLAVVYHLDDVAGVVAQVALQAFHHLVQESEVAGNILGAEQHGHMDKIGYELYSKLLKEEMSGEKEKIPELDVRVSAFIPDSYMESGASRMEAYKEIAEIDGAASEKQFRTACKEVFGEIPEETDNLINIAVVKRKASKYGVENITVSSGETFVQFDNFKVFANDKLMKMVEKFSKSVKISMSGAPKLEFLLDGATNSEKLTFIRRFFDYVDF